jgi:hypothetical protein
MAEATEGRAPSVTFRFPPEVYGRLDAAARDEDRSLNSMCSRLLTEALDARSRKASRARKYNAT